MLFPFLFSLRKWLMNQVILQDWLHSRNRRRRMVVIWFLCLIMHWRRRMEVVLRRSMFLQNICGISFYLIKSLQRHWYSVWKSRQKCLIFNCKQRNLIKLPKSPIFAQTFKWDISASFQTLWSKVCNILSKNSILSKSKEFAQCWIWIFAPKAPL